MADEYIRKQDAVNVVANTAKIVASFNYQYAIDALSALTPADVVQVVHAHWIQTSAEDENGNAYYSCSNCGRGESHNPIVEVPYCWKCGAKMDGGDEHEID